jgi:hypothetical protein
VFVAGVADDKIPKDALADPTASLSGTVTWGQLSAAAGGGACPAVHKVSYLVQAAPVEEKPAAAAEEEQDTEEKAAEAAHAAKVTVLKGMKVATAEHWAAAKKTGETLQVGLPCVGREASASLVMGLWLTSAVHSRLLQVRQAAPGARPPSLSDDWAASRCRHSRSTHRASSWCWRQGWSWPMTNQLARIG